MSKQFDSTIEQSNVPNLPSGSKVKIQSVPFIKAYEELSTQHDIDEFYKKVSKLNMPDTLDDTFENNTIVKAITDVDSAKLKHASKYIFTNSAMKMHETIFTLPKTQWVPIFTHMWVELETPVTTPYGENVKAIYASKAYPISEIDRVMPISKDKTLNNALHKVMSVHKNHWSLDIITLRCKMLFDFTYDLATNQWVYLASHICQYGKCDYPIPTDINGKHAGLCVPCQECKAACEYWSSWLHYAIEMIQGIYALEATKPSFPIATIEYTQEEKVKVGKGKNQRTLRQDVTRGIDYTFVRYDVSTKKHHELPELTEQEKKRANWLVLTDSSNIIWEHVKIKPYTRRYPIKRDGTRTDGIVSITDDFMKWIPMLRERRTIKRVVASQFETKEK